MIQVGDLDRDTRKNNLGSPDFLKKQMLMETVYCKEILWMSSYEFCQAAVSGELRFPKSLGF